MSRGESSRRALDLDVVDHRGEDLLPRAVLMADRDPDELPALVLARLVAEPDRRRLATPLELVDEGGREEVERVEAAGHDGPAYRLNTRLNGGAPPLRLSGSAIGEPLFADEGHEPARGDTVDSMPPSAERSRVSTSAPGSASGITMRPAGRELGEQARGRRRGRGVHGDRVERRPIGRAPRPVADPHLDRPGSSASSRARASVASSAKRSMLSTSRGEQGEHRGRVARAGADLEHALVAGEAEALADRRHHPGLGDRLPVTDRQRRVGVRAAPEPLGDEQLPRHRGHRGEHPVVADPPPAKLTLDHPRALIGG